MAPARIAIGVATAAVIAVTIAVTACGAGQRVSAFSPAQSIADPSTETATPPPETEQPAAPAPDTPASATPLPAPTTTGPDPAAGSPTARPVFIATARPPAVAATATPAQAARVPTITAVPGRVPVRIIARDNRFDPEYVEVQSGTLVRWENRGANDHDVVADDLAFESPVFRPGQTYQYVFGQPGAFTYLCDLHEGMIGTITVQ